MKPADPPQFFVVRDTDMMGTRVLYGRQGGQGRYVFARETLEAIRASFVPSWRWRPGEYKTSLKGWRTRRAAERFAAKLTPYKVRVYYLAVDVVDGEEVDRLVECGPADTGTP